MKRLIFNVYTIWQTRRLCGLTYADSLTTIAKISYKNQKLPSPPMQTHTCVSNVGIKA